MSFDDVCEKLWEMSKSRAVKSKAEFRKALKQVVYDASEEGIRKGIEVKADMAKQFLEDQFPN